MYNYFVQYRTVLWPQEVHEEEYIMTKYLFELSQWYDSEVPEKEDQFAIAVLREIRSRFGTTTGTLASVKTSITGLKGCDSTIDLSVTWLVKDGFGSNMPTPLAEVMKACFPLDAYKSDQEMLSSTSNVVDVIEKQINLMLERAEEITLHKCGVANMYARFNKSA